MLKSIKTPAIAITLALTAGAAHAGDVNGSMTSATGDHSPSVQVATGTEEMKTTFTEQKKAAEETFDSWVSQIGEHAETANENAQDVAEEAGEALDDAWTEVRASWEEAKDATEDNWEEAKAKFDESVERLEAAWNELKGG